MDNLDRKEVMAQFERLPPERRQQLMRLLERMLAKDVEVRTLMTRVESGEISARELLDQM